MDRFFNLLSFAFPLIFISAVAQADCAIVQVPNEVVCSGNDNDGFISNQNSVFMEVIETARVRNQGDAIRLDGNNSKVNIFGTVSSSQENGLLVGDATDISVFGPGSITATADGIRALNDLGLNLFGQSSVDSGATGIKASNGADIFTGGGQNITSIGDGIDVQEDAFIDNNGIIHSTGQDGDGVEFDNGTLLNWGDIQSDQGVGVKVSESAAETSHIENVGSILGQIGVFSENELSTASQTINNNGSIVGLSGVAIDLGGGNDVLSMQTGSSIEGNAIFGNGDDLLTFQSGGIFSGLVGDFDLFDGGENFDIVKFFSLDFNNVTGSLTTDEVIFLSIVDGLSEFSVGLKNWERYEFANAQFTTQELIDALSVPLPGSLALLLPVAMAGAAFGAKRRSSRC